MPSASALSRALCLVAASALIGCASKNPLMDEPVATAPAAQPAAAAKAAPPATPATASAVPVLPATPAAQPAQTAAAPAPAPAATGVQTTQQKRLFGILSPYKIDVQQGNFISQEQLSQLKTGMTPEQVHFILGTPLLNDLFHANRWDYVFRMQKGSGDVISSRIAVHFQDNRVAKIDAGSLPNEQDYLSLIAGSKPDAPKASK
ncbi:outer membrane protein assembly factor BamE [Janthinobacterium sp. 17J80-10]|uniref:outer membrane protein assembly factor BamE n=1 Tax=Janthinobacterium sp. 17J80-10 TaxID=2497863 RepID=UPI001F50EE6E|nr:outer membrane protein assembly factor BamE [Janthinobacterium sp. 17J80-10]